MSGARARPPAPALLPGARRPSAWLVLAALILSILAGLDLTAAAVAARTADAWRDRLDGSITIAVAGRGLESADAAAARAAETLAGAPGVASVRVLDPAPGDGFAAEAMGVAARDSEGGAPRLLAVTPAAAAAPDAAALANRLRALGLQAAGDDHQSLDSPLERLALAVAGAAAVLLLALLMTLWPLAAWGAGRAGRRLAARLDLLARLGASETQLAPPLAGGAATAVVTGAVLGAATAAAIAAAALWFPEARTWLADRGAPTVVADGWDLAPVGLWPALALLVAPLGARSAARRAVRRLP